MNIDDKLINTAVVWSSPVQDGYGDFTFAVPVEVLVRREDQINLVRTTDGREVTSRAKFFTTKERWPGVVQGWIAEGELDSNTPTDPRDYDRAWEILKVDTIPALKTTDTTQTLVVVYV